MLTTVLSLIVVLGVLVFIHEAGHFVAAKWAGIYVHRFSLGLGSPIRWLTFRRGETEYSVSWIPLGGYVKMASRRGGYRQQPARGRAAAAARCRRDRIFESKPLWKRMIVILAGVTMNALFAWLLFTFLAAKNGRQIDPVTTVGRVVPELVPAGAEALQDLRPGSRIVAVNGRPVSSWNEVEQGILNASEPRGSNRARRRWAASRCRSIPDALEGRIKASQAIQPFRAAGDRGGHARPAGGARRPPEGRHHPGGRWPPGRAVVRSARGAPARAAGSALAFEVARGRGASHALDHARRWTRSPTPTGSAPGRRGSAWPCRPTSGPKPLSLPQAVVEGWKSTVVGLDPDRPDHPWALQRTDLQARGGGPIMIGQLAGESARLGLDAFLAFMALISINLAILNLLPVPDPRRRAVRLPAGGGRSRAARCRSSSGSG